MALPSSPPISFSQVRTEFSANGTSANFSAYVRGGAYVPNHGNTASIPTSSSGMSLSNFYGADIDSPVTNHTVYTSGSGYDSCQTGSPGASCGITAGAMANVSNGVGPFTYSWSHISGDTFTVTAPTSAATNFTKTAGTPAIDGTCNHFSGVYRCTVTDLGNGSYQAYADITISSDHCFIFA